MEENCLKSFEMLGKAFCGNGFIHLNIAEIHEEHLGARKGELRLLIRLQNERFWA